MLFRQKLINVLFLLVIALSISHARPTGHDFLLSQEDTSCKFQQSYPILYADGSHTFLVIWQDYRNGPAQFFAQLFDSVGNPIGENFPIYSNDIIFSPDNSFLALGEEYVTWGNDQLEYTYYYMKGRFCRTDGTWSEPIEFASAILPWCGTGYVGIYHDMKRFSNGYLIAFNDDGLLSLSKHNWNHETLWNWNNSREFSSEDSIRPSTISTCFNSMEDLGVVWVNVPYALPESTSFFGMRGTFFDRNDSIIAENILLKSGEFLGDPNSWYRWTLKVLSVSDSLYEVFALNRDSLIVYYWKVNRFGNTVGDTREVRLYSDNGALPGIYASLENFNITSMVNNRFYIGASIRTVEGSSSQGKTGSMLFSFNSNGDLISNAFKDSSSIFDYGNLFFNSQDSLLITPSCSDGDIYINAYRNLSLVWNKKVNNNTPASNDNASRIITINDSTMFMTWKDEKNIFGHRVSNDGQVHGPMEILQGDDDFQFLPDGSALRMWIKKTNDSSSVIGYSIFNETWSLKKTDTLEANAKPGYSYGTFLILPDTSFIAMYRINANNYFLWHVKNDDGIEKIVLPFSNANYSYRLIAENDTSFWVVYSEHLRLMSKSLKSLSNEYSNINFSEYLGDGRFIRLGYEGLNYYNTLRQYYGMIFSVNGDTLVQKFPIEGEVNTLLCKKLTKDYFLIVYRKGTQIYSRTYTSQGIPYSGLLTVASDGNSLKLDPLVELNRKKVFILWSDVREPGRGYDAYYNILDIDEMTPVKELKQIENLSYRLDQNYPNPFNPSTTIRYRIPASGLVTLKVYDILGREVMILTDERQFSGYHEVIFNAGNLASGIYFYQLKAGSYVQTKKLLFLK